MTPSPAEGIRVALTNRFDSYKTREESPMTGFAAFAAHNDDSAGMLRERETSRPPVFRINAASIERSSQLGKKHESRRGRGPTQADKKRLVTE